MDIEPNEPQTILGGVSAEEATRNLQENMRPLMYEHLKSRSDRVVVSSEQAEQLKKIIEDSIDLGYLLRSAEMADELSLEQVGARQRVQIEDSLWEIETVLGLELPKEQR